MAQVSIRATIRGAHEGLVEPLVVPGNPGNPGDPGDPGDAAGSARERHQVLLQPLQQQSRDGGRRLEVVVDGWRFEVEVEPESRAALREKARRDRGEGEHSGPAEVHAIIPGVVVSVAVAPGDTVEPGQQLLVVEAMKMQNELRAPRAGTVARVTVGERSTVEVGDVLVVIE